MFCILPTLQNMKHDDFVKNIYDMIRTHTKITNTQCYIPDLQNLICNFFQTDEFDLITLLKQHSEKFVVTTEDSYVYCIE